MDALKAVVARTRELTSKPFGVAIVLAFPHEELLQHIYAEKVAFLQVYFGDFPKARVDEAHAMGVKVLHQVRQNSPNFLLEIFSISHPENHNSEPQFSLSHQIIDKPASNPSHRIPNVLASWSRWGLWRTP